MSVKCSVCLEGYDSGNTDPMCTPCGHIFHHACIRECLETSKNCPECRRAVGGSGDLRQLYFNVDHNTPSDLSPPPTEGDDMTSILRQWIHDLKCEREKERIKFKETTTKYLKKISDLEKTNAENDKLIKDLRSKTSELSDKSQATKTHERDVSFKTPWSLAPVLQTRRTPSFDFPISEPRVNIATPPNILPFLAFAGCSSESRRSSPSPSSIQEPKKSFPCNLCDRSFGSQGWLTRHTREVHESRGFSSGTSNSSVGIPSPVRQTSVSYNSQPSPKPFQCQVCGASYGSQGWLTRHTNQKH